MEMVPRFGTIMYYRPIPRLQTNKKKKKEKKRKRKKEAINVATPINMELVKMTKHNLTSESYFFLVVH